MAGRKLRKGAAKKILASMVVTLAVTYVVSGLLYGITEMIHLQDAVMDVQGVIQFVQTTNFQNQLVITIIAIIFFGWFVKQLGIFQESYEDASDYGVHGSGQMGSVKEYIKKGIISKKDRSKYSPRNANIALTAEEGIILARNPNAKSLIILPENSSADNRNVLVIGSSGSAKGQSYVIPNLVNLRKESIIVTDPKGELYAMTGQLKQDQGYRVIQIDFKNFEQSRYNPLDYVQTDEDAQNVSMTIATNATKDGKFDFFMERAQKMLQGLIVYCKSVNQEANLNDVIHTYNEYVVPDEETFLDFVENEVGKEHTAYQTLKGLTSLEGNTRASVLSSFSSQISIFQIDKVNKMTRKSDFHFYDLQKQKTIIYVKMPMRKNPFQAVTATFFDQMLDHLYAIADRQPNQRLPLRTAFLLDEFPNIGKINGYDETLATCRGLGISMQTIIQDIAQLEKMYGKEASRTIISNHATRLFLKTGDPDTAKYFSRLTETTTVKVKTSGRSESAGLFHTRPNNNISQNEQYQKKELISEGRLNNLADDECFIFSTSADPLHAKKAFQFVIYKGFLTDKNRNICYSQNRKKYIKQFKLTPYTPQELTLHHEEQQTTIESKDEMEISIGQSKEIPDTAYLKDERLNSQEDQVISEASTELATDDVLVDHTTKEQEIKELEEINEESDEFPEEEMQILSDCQINDKEETINEAMEEINETIDELTEMEDEIGQDAINDALEDLLSENESSETEVNNTEEEDLAEQLPM